MTKAFGLCLMAAIVACAGCNEDESCIGAGGDVYAQECQTCHGDGAVTISHVLKAMGIPENFALGTIRVSVGRMTSDEDVTKGLAAIIRGVQAAAGESQG